MSLTDQDKVAVVRKWFHEGMSSNCLETASQVAREVFTEDFVDGDGPNAPASREEFLSRVVTNALRTFEDIDARIEFAMVHGDVIASRLRFSAIQRGAFLGFEPTGTRISFTETGFAFLRGAQIYRTMGDWDRHGVYLQLHRATAA